jgi:hypothetical protein
MLYAWSMYKKDVLKHYKTITAVANVLGISPAAVSQWDELIPPVSARALADSTDALTFDPRLYRHCTPEKRRLAEALSDPS